MGVVSRAEPNRVEGQELRVVSMMAATVCMGLALQTGASQGRPVAVLSTLAHVWSGLLSTLAGSRMHRGEWRAWQPFQGGVAFVMFQGFGWLLFSTALMFNLILLLDTSPTAGYASTPLY